MSAHLDPALKACNVLGRFLYYRGLQLLAEPLRPGFVSEKDLIDGHTPPALINGILDSLGSWPLIAARRRPDGAPGGQLVYIMVITDRSDAAHKTKSMEALLQQAERRAVEGAVVGWKAAHPGEAAPEFALKEMIVIAPDDAVAKKSLQGAFAGVAENSQVRFQFLPFIKFSTVVPEAKLVPPHRVATAAEVEEYLRVSMIPRANLPHIARDDAAVIWAGAAPGECVCVMRASGTAIERVPVYRLVR